VPQDDVIELESTGPTAVLWLNRPDKRNAIAFETWAMLPALVDEAVARGARTLIVRGRGGHFCAGADIGEVGVRLADAHDPAGYRAANAAAERALSDAPLVTIAAIEGSCVGGGCQIAASCDLRIATTTARLGITPAKLGISYPAVSVARTVALVGAGAAKRLLLTAELIDGVEAHRIGLVDLLADEASFDAALSALIETVGSGSLVTQLAAREMIGEIAEAGQIAATTVTHWEATALGAGDLEEGLAAFAERRVPRFGWRPPRTTS